MTLAKTLWRFYVLSQRAQREQHISLLRSQAGRKGTARANWTRWHRERVLESCMPEVKKIARTVARMFPPHLDIHELEQQGYVGLLQAAKRYDPASGKKFEPFAYFRIRGAIIDANRRSTYREETHDSVEALNERPGVAQIVVIDPAPLPDEQIVRAEMEALVAKVIQELPKEARGILERAMAGDSAAQIAADCGMRATQVRKILADLRKTVGERVREISTR